MPARKLQCTPGSERSPYLAKTWCQQHSCGSTDCTTNATAQQQQKTNDGVVVVAVVVVEVLILVMHVVGGTHLRIVVSQVVNMNADMAPAHSIARQASNVLHCCFCSPKAESAVSTDTQTDRQERMHSDA